MGTHLHAKTIEFCLRNIYATCMLKDSGLRHCNFSNNKSAMPVNRETAYVFCLCASRCEPL